MQKHIEENLINIECVVASSCCNYCNAAGVGVGVIHLHGIAITCENSGSCCITFTYVSFELRLTKLRLRLLHFSGLHVCNLGMLQFIDPGFALYLPIRIID